MEQNNGTKEIYYGQYDLTGKPFGKGFLLNDQGEIYEGYWLDGVKSGRGRSIDSNGNIYEGEYFNN